MQVVTHPPIYRAFLTEKTLKKAKLVENQNNLAWCLELVIQGMKRNSGHFKNVGKRCAHRWSHLAYSNTSVDHGLRFSFSIFCSASNITLKRKTLVFLFNRAGFFFSFYMGFYIILFFFSFIDFEKSSSIIQIKFIDLEKN